MKTIKPLTAIILLFFNCSGNAQTGTNDAVFNTPGSAANVQKEKLNFFVISKRVKGRFDMATRFNVFRTTIKGWLRPQKFVSIKAASADEAGVKIRERLDADNKKIGTLWFDSHGMYKKGYSLFFIGDDEISCKTLLSESVKSSLQKIAAYADTGTKIIIGSCYGGATYLRSSIDYKDTMRMDGDSLMMKLGSIFKKAVIYGSESWVCTKPGLFLERAAAAGFPGRKLFLDECYKPAWENMGRWNEYNAVSRCFSSVNPVTLDMYGNAKVREIPYSSQPRVQHRIRKHLDKLQRGLYH